MDQHMYSFILAAHKITTVTGEPPTFTDWLYDYWWVVVLSAIALIAIAIWIYKRQTRLHKITLYVGKEPTVYEVQHGTTFSAPIPDGKETFKGWYRDSACMIPFNSSDKIVSDFSLYSKFE